MSSTGGYDGRLTQLVGFYFVVIIIIILCFEIRSFYIAQAGIELNM